MALVFCSGFDAGVLPTAGNTTNLFVDYITGSPAVTTSTPKHGAYCLEISQTAATEALGFTTNTLGAGKNRSYSAFYVYFPTTLPVADVHLALWFNSSGGTPSLTFNAGTGKLAVRHDSGAETDGPTIAANTWYLVESCQDLTSDPRRMDWWVDGAAQTPLTEAVTDIFPNADTRSFETSTAGYVQNVGTATITRSTTQAHVGSASLKCAITATGDFSTYYGTDVLPTTSGLSYIGTAWVYISNARTISLTNPFGAQVGTPVSVPANTWTRLEYTYTASSVNGGVNILVTSAVNGDILYVDDLSFREVPTLVGFELADSSAAQTMTARFDDLVLYTDTAAIAAPMSPHTVSLLSVDPAGTVTLSGTSGNFNTFTSNGTLAAWNATTARDNIDEVPPTIGASADGFVQVTAATGDYVEIPMTSYTLGAGEVVAGGRMVAIGWATSGTACTLGFRSWNGTTERTLQAGTVDPNFDASTTVHTAVCKMLTLADINTQGELDALAFRVGFSNDATPDVGIHAIYAEVAIQAAAGVNVTAGLISTTVTGNAPTITAAPNAGAQSVAVTQQNPSVATVVNAGLITVAATQQNPSVATVVNAGLITVAVTELSPTVTTDAVTSVNAGLITVAATQQAPSVTTLVNAGLISVAVTQQDPAAGTFVNAGLIAVTVAEPDPTVTTDVVTTVNAGLITVAVTQQSPNAAVAASAGLVTVATTFRDAAVNPMSGVSDFPEDLPFDLGGLTGTPAAPPVDPTSPTTTTTPPRVIVEAPPASHILTLRDWRGGESRELTQVWGQTLTLSLTDAATMAFTVDGTADPHTGQLDAAALHEGVSDVTWKRDGVDLLTGRLVKATDSVDDTKSTVTCSCVDYLGVLERRLITGALTYTSKSPEFVVAALLDAIQAGGDLGITKAAFPATGRVLAESKFADGDNGKAAILKLAQLGAPNGFDFWVTPDRIANMAYPERGANNNVSLDYGGAIASFTRDVDLSKFANVVRQSGDAPGTPPVPLTKLIASDINNQPEGRWDASFSDTSLKTQTEVDGAAQANYDRSVRILPAYTVVLAPRFWRGTSHVGLGDYVSVVVRAGRLDVNDLLRVTSIQVSLSDTGEETVTLTLGQPKIDLLKKIMTGLQNLARR